MLFYCLNSQHQQRRKQRLQVNPSLIKNNVCMIKPILFQQQALQQQVSLKLLSLSNGKRRKIPSKSDIIILVKILFDRYT